MCVSQLQQAAEEKATVTSQLRGVSQTLRDTQTRCQWLEGQVQGHGQVDPPSPPIGILVNLLLVLSLLLV